MATTLTNAANGVALLLLLLLLLLLPFPQALGTDMAQHFEELAKFKSKLIQVARSNSASHIATDADTQMFLKMAMHTADVSNPAKPWIYARHWAELIAEEFYNQGDRERGLGLTISAFMDRNKPNLPKLQLSFINFIVAPLFEVSHAAHWPCVTEER